MVRFVWYISGAANSLLEPVLLALLSDGCFEVGPLMGPRNVFIILYLLLTYLTSSVSFYMHNFKNILSICIKWFSSIIDLVLG